MHGQNFPLITNNTGCLMTIRIAAGSSAFGESLLFSENLKEIYRNPKKLKPLTYHSITNGDFCFFSQWITIESQRRER